ncbi:ATP-grasp domain-containing protein [Streptomyces scopuliridis]|uniref:ATP-grasp domain-containing protein n=1 Tax=Streptomyces scopuliridis TaxID=452529 RepID=UPI003674AF7C
MHIAIVDGYSTGAALARQLYALGVTCTHVQSQPQANEHLRRSFDAATYLANLGYDPDLQMVADRLTTLGVSRITAGAESGVTLAEQLSLHLGLPTNSAEHLAARRDKRLMGQAVAASGLATPRTHVARTPTAGRRWFEASGLPEAVVKPLASAGSDNVWFCRTAADVEAACASVLAAPTIFGEPNRAALVQERLVGSEYYINTVSHDGHHRVAEIWRYTKQVSPVSTPVYDYEEPVEATTQEARTLRRFTFAVLDALGIKSSPAHTEVMLTARGPVLIETGARLGGATAPDVVERYCGVSQTSLAAAALVDPQNLLDFDDTQTTWTGAVRHVEFVNHRQGQADANAAQKVAELPSAVAVGSAVDPGELIAPTGSLLSSPGYAYLAADDRDAVERDYARLREWERQGLHTV